MIHYLGKKVEIDIDPFVKTSWNKAKKWRYGYNEQINVIIISKDGTLGDVYSVNGINIGLPEVPNKKEIINHEKFPKDQKWKREELPQGLNEKTQNEPRFEQYIDLQFKRRFEGVWIYIKGQPVYIPGTYWFGIQWVRDEVDYPDFRNIQNELMIFWEACKADQRCYGMQYVKNRRIGASFLSIVELLESGSINEDKLLGIVSKSGGDSQKLFNRLVKGFKRLPCFFKPLQDGTNTPKKELVFDVPTKRKGKNDVESEEGLSTIIYWVNTTINAMDGDAIFRSVLDESGKYPKDVPFDKYWYIVKTSHSKGIRITGKSMVVSTVNAKNKGGQEYENIWDASEISVRDKNGQTESGLYRIFIPAKYCLEGMFDEYGFTIIEDPEKPIMTDEGIMTSIGSITWLQNKADSIKNPEDLNEFYRQFPNEVEDAFRDESGNCAFNTINLAEQLRHNKNVLLDNTTGNEEVERGNFSWVNGIQDTTVQWNPDPLNGRFWIAKKCHPSPEYRNLKEKKTVNGITAWSPVNEHIGCFGVDPYNTSESADGKGSMGAILLTTKYNTGPFPNNALILEYLDRAPKIELFFEDVLMAMVYFSMPMLCELSNYEFLRMIKNRGYRHFSLNNPYKTYAELNPAEKEFGGVPPQNDKIGEQQFYATEAYVFDYMGVAKNDQNRLVGEMGYFPFSRTIEQLQKVDVKKRTKFDAYIGLSLSLIGNQKRIYKAIEQKPIQLSSLFKTFDNTGNVSKSY